MVVDRFLQQGLLEATGRAPLQGVVASFKPTSGLTKGRSYVLWSLFLVSQKDMDPIQGL